MRLDFLALGCTALLVACSASNEKDDRPSQLVPTDASTVVDSSTTPATDAAIDTEPTWDLEASPPCSELKCRRATCADGTTTTLSGQVFDPSGKLPLYGVAVYVPNEDLASLPKGATCASCESLVSGAPIVSAVTDARGKFTLENVPVGENVPVVVQVGKWRRKVTVPNVEKCTSNSVGSIKLPKKKSEGDMPRVAVATGGADAMECIFKRIGIDDSEFTAAGGTGSFHIYKGRSGSTVSGSTDATSFWGDLSKLKAYDMVVLSCEGSEYGSDKASAVTAMRDYANAGGRIFASHYHYYWFSSGPSDFQSTATWSPGGFGSDGTFSIDTSFPKGKSFADWLVNVGASTTKGSIYLKDIRTDASAVNTKTSQRWIYSDTPKYFTFNTPIGKAAASQCGRVVFTDLHVASGNNPGGSFPSNCTTGELTAQEKALVFLLFDLAACVVPDSDPPAPPPVK